MTYITTPSSPQATNHPTAGSFVVDRWRLNKISGAINEPPKTLTAARETLDELKKQLAEISTTCARADAPASLAEIKQRATTARPKNLEDARVIFADIASMVDRAAAPSAPSAIADLRARARAIASATAPSVSASAGANLAAMTDDQLLAQYGKLTGADRFAFFAAHGARIWRAHENSVRRHIRRG
jgi:hypothetical protein